MTPSSATSVPDDVERLCSLLTDTAAFRPEVEAAFGRWWAARDPRGQALLHALALRAGEHPDLLETLLVLLAQRSVVRSALYGVLVDSHDVAEAEQSTLAAVALRIEQFEGRAQFTTWLWEVARNEARMLLRARRRRPAVPVAEPDPGAFLARCSTLVADRDLVLRCLATLTESAREVVELREVRGLPYEDIAAQLDVPVGTVRSRLSRARAQLATALRDELDAV